jgi:hypothetical protein
VQRSRLLWTAHDEQRRSAHDEQRPSALDSGARNSAQRSGTARSRRTEVRKPRAAAYIKCAQRGWHVAANTLRLRPLARLHMKGLCGKITLRMGRVFGSARGEPEYES